MSVIIFFAIIAFLGVISAAIAGNWDPVQIFVDLGSGCVWSIDADLSGLDDERNQHLRCQSGSGQHDKLVTGKNIDHCFGCGYSLSRSRDLFVPGPGQLPDFDHGSPIPTTGVLVVDYFIRNRRQMLAEELFKGEDSAYWFYKGWNIRAVIAWAAGAIVTFAVPDAWIPAISAMVVSGSVYHLLTMNTEGCGEQEPDGNGYLKGRSSRLAQGAGTIAYLTRRVARKAVLSYLRWARRRDGGTGFVRCRRTRGRDALRLDPAVPQVRGRAWPDSQARRGSRGSPKPTAGALGRMPRRNGGSPETDLGMAAPGSTGRTG